jgi:DNA-binding NtrC family response regulator
MSPAPIVENKLFAGLMVYVMSAHESVVEQVRAAVKTSVLHVANATAFFDLATARARRKGSCVIIDLATLPDPRAFIATAKRSPAISNMPLILFGTEGEHERLPDEVRSAVRGSIVVPVTTDQLEAAIVSLCQIRSQ